MKEEINTVSIACIKERAVRIRKRILDLSMVGNGNSHYGGSLSLVEILATLYSGIMKYDSNNPKWVQRDRLFLSKGHAVLCYYATLEDIGVISKEQVETYQHDFGDFSSHPVMNLDIGIEASNGSLGHGLSLAIGSLLAARIKNEKYRAIVIMGNGECNEGSVWEGAMAAEHYKLDYLIVVIDNNGLQSDGDSKNVMNSSCMEAKWKAFGWNAMSVNGHDPNELKTAFESLEYNTHPTVIIANTIKGKGVSFMENDNSWHHNKMTSAQYEQALSEVCAYDRNRQKKN